MFKQVISFLEMEIRFWDSSFFKSHEIPWRNEFKSSAIS